MSDKSLKTYNVHIVKADSPAEQPVEKGATSAQVKEQADAFAFGWVEPTLEFEGLSIHVKHSSILPQCIRAYKYNIAGFGIGVRYKMDYSTETPEMKNEYTKAENIINLLNMDKDTKEVFEDVIEARETYGISYIEALRNVGGEVDGIEFIINTKSIRKTAPLEPYVDVDYNINGQTETRKRKFCKYRQTTGNKTVYFKEMGDPRIMNKTTGKYVDALAPEDQANEIMEFAIGTEIYGEIRWIGQILGVDGARKAEELNNRYFGEGRHTPLLILIKNGKLSDGSFEKLKAYMNDIKGESGQHSFMVLEAESADSTTLLDQEKPPEIQTVPLAEILQKDELFQDYLNNNRKKVQSAFLLPDLYVGYTTDFNRATAQTAMEITEEQVFQPERASLAWVINHKLLKDYNFKYVEAYFKSPNVTNPEDLSAILSICERAGGLSPNKAKEIAYNALGETAEAYPGEWGEIPVAYLRSSVAIAGKLKGLDTTESVTEELAAQIEKATKSGDRDIAAIMKEVRSLLLDVGDMQGKGDADVEESY